MNNEAIQNLLFDHDDRSTALMATGFLEDFLALAIFQKFRRPLSENQAAELFTGYGPLATLASKVTIGHLLGIITNDAKHDLGHIRTIRNDFAHTYEPLTFESNTIAGRCKSLKLKHKLNQKLEARAGDGSRGRFIRSAMQIFALTLMAVHVPMAETKRLNQNRAEINQEAKEAFDQIQKDVRARLA
jgi:hypothetical protein